MKAAAVFARVLLCLALVAGGGASAFASWYSPELKQKAEQGDAEAQADLGWAYYNGIGVKRDRAAAAKWWDIATEQYRLAAEQGNAEAQYQLGRAHLADWGGFSFNKTEALKWLRLAADQKHAKAMLRLANNEQDKAEATKLRRLAVEQYRLAAEQGDAEAQLQLGRAYYYGNNGVEKDFAEAVKWYRLAAEQGNKNAQKDLGDLYATGKGVEEDFTAATKWWRLAAEQGGSLYWHIVSAYEYGKIGRDNADALTVIQLAVKKYLPAAELGDDDAQYALGHMYLNGYGVEKNGTEAAKWYNLAAKQNHGEAQYALGVMYEEGRGVERDEVEAFRLFLRSNKQVRDSQEKLSEIFRPAAERGDAYAQYELGNLMSDDEKKLKWWRRAAEQGYVKAQANLGEIYDKSYLAKRHSIERDYTVAAKWYRLAAKQGHAGSQNRLGFLLLWGDVKRDSREAVKWLRRADKQGQSSPQLGWRYFHGDAGVTQDYYEAYVRLFAGRSSDSDEAKKAKANLTAAQIESAEEEAQKREKRREDLQKKKEKAAEEAALEWRRANVVPDLRRKGDAYYKGKGVLPNYKEAAKWYRQAAERGDAEAQYRLGLMYAEGKRGVEQNHVEAYIWLALAGVNDTGEIGDKAASLRESVEKSLTAEQFEQAQAEATERLEKIKAKQ